MLAGSYPSGPSSAEPPAIWQMITGNEIPAYNVPSGILFDMHREAAAKRPGVLTKIGMDTFVDPDARRLRDERQGGRASRSSRASTSPATTGSSSRRSSPNVAIIRATTADERGNLSYEHEGGYLGPLDQALAVRNNGGIVIAQVKRLAAAGTLQAARRRRARHAGRRHRRRARPDADDADGSTIRRSRARSSGRCRRSRSPKFDVAKVIARRVAQELRDGDAVNIGFGISANVPRILIEEGRHGAVTWVIEQGAVGGVPLLDFQFGCASNAEAIVPSPYQFTYFQGGGLRMLAALVPADRPRRLRQRLQARRAPACDGGRRRLRRHHGAGEEDRLLRLLHRRRRACDRGRRARASTRKARSRSSSRRSSRSPSPARARSRKGQDIIYVTERCVHAARARGRDGRPRSRPASISSATCSRRPNSRLRVAADLQTMDAALVSSGADRSEAAVRSGRRRRHERRFVELTFEGPLARITLQARRQAQRARSAR